MTGAPDRARDGRDLTPCLRADRRMDVRAVERCADRRGPAPRGRSPLGALALVAALAAGCQPARPKSVVLITLDTVRADRVGACGGSVPTPRLEALARRGVVFDHADTPVPLTGPSHASLFTGVPPWRHGLRLNGINALDPHRAVIAEELAAKGFDTAAFVAAFPVTRPFGFARGFATFDDRMGVTPAGAPFRQLQGDEITQRATQWIAQRGERPFFLWVHYFDAHAPHEAPEPFASAHPGDPYAGEIAYLDDQVGRLLDAVSEKVADDDLLVVVVGDHGEGLGDHGEDEHGLLLYEDTLHVPFILAGGGAEAGRHVVEPVSLIDVRPTILGAFGWAAPGAEGIDLMPAARGDQEAPARALHAETLYPQSEFGWSPLRATRRGALKAIDAPKRELYDLDADPGERDDLAARRPADVEALAMLGESSGAAGAMASSEQPSAADLEALQSLGYVGAGAGRSAGDAHADPKDHIADYREFWRASHLGLEGRPEDLPEAITAFDGLVARDPANPLFRFRHAMLLEKAGRLDEAEAQMREVVRRAPDWPPAVRRLASLLASTGRAGEAADLLRAFAQANPGIEGIDIALSASLRAAGRLDEALDVAQRAAKDRPDDADIACLAAELLAANGRFGEARASFEQILGRDPRNARAALGLARVLEHDGHPEEALALLERTLAALPGQPVLLAEACRLATTLGRADAARTCAGARR